MSKDKDQAKKCGTCNGTGQTDHVEWRNGDPHYRVIQCPACKGTGRA